MHSRKSGLTCSGDVSNVSGMNIRGAIPGERGDNVEVVGGLGGDDPPELAECLAIIRRLYFFDPCLVSSLFDEISSDVSLPSSVRHPTRLRLAD